MHVHVAHFQKKTYKIFKQISYTLSHTHRAIFKRSPTANYNNFYSSSHILQVELKLSKYSITIISHHTKHSIL
jgi:hypothetical protein